MTIEEFYAINPGKCREKKNTGNSRVKTKRRPCSIDVRRFFWFLSAYDPVKYLGNGGNVKGKKTIYVLPTLDKGLQAAQNLSCSRHEIAQLHSIFKPKII